MHILSDSVALGYPIYSTDLETTMTGWASCQEGQSTFHVKIGVGGTLDEIPLRVLGYAACISDALERDVRILAGSSPLTLSLFSSGPKSGNKLFDRHFLGVASLALALRSIDVKHTISINLALPTPEIPDCGRASFPDDLQSWVSMRAETHSNYDPASFSYAFEHAAPSMFGDLTQHLDTTQFNLTLGGATEARFWAVRQAVRKALIENGINVVPAAAIIMKAIRVPWYQPIDAEPTLTEGLANYDDAKQKFSRSTNPKYGGNSGLKREYNAFKKTIREKHVLEVANSIIDVECAISACLKNKILIDQRTLEMIGKRND